MTRTSSFPRASPPLARRTSVPSQRGSIIGLTSTEIVREAERAIERVEPEAATELRRLLGQMHLRIRPSPHHIPDEMLDLADPKDVHVVAAAVRNRVQYLVRFNLRDFRCRLLRERFGVQVLRPDALIRTIVRTES